MFEWNKRYEIGVALVDDEHNHLFEILNEIATEIANGDNNSDHLNTTMNELLDYAKQHFTHEEALMVEVGVDPRHSKRQQMEHKSFFYDIEKLRIRDTDQPVKDHFEKLVKFVTSWLVFHTLRTDQQLGIQIREIKAGQTPSDAYDISLEANFSVAIYRPVVEALLHLWTEAAHRVTHLEMLLENK